MTKHNMTRNRIASNQRSHPMSDNGYPLRRTLLVSLGHDAHAVAVALADHGRTWLGVEPPLAHIDGDALVKFGQPGPEQFDAELSKHALDALKNLAGERTENRLREHGFYIRDHAEIDLWLLQSISERATDQQMEGASIADEAMPAPEVSSALLESLTDFVWRHMRAHTTINIALLAEPAQEPNLRRYSDHLWRLDIAGVHIASPINQQHMRIEQAEWHQRVATAVASLVFGSFPSYMMPAVESPQVLAIGAQSWQAPRTELLHWLHLRSGYAIMQSILEGPGEPSRFQPPRGGRQDSGHLPEVNAPPVQELFQQLDAAMPSVPLQPWRARRFTWPDLATLANRIEADVNQGTTVRHEQARRIRQSWLESQLAVWDNAMEEMERACMQPNHGWPQVESRQTRLATLLAALQRQSVEIEQQLDVAGRGRGKAETRCKQTLGRLTALCASLPAYTPRSIGLAVVQPWRWPLWLWAASNVLPRRGQQWVNAQVESERSIQVEANWHLLRQYLLALQHDVKTRLDQIDRVSERITVLAADWGDALENTASRMPTPWTGDRLEQTWCIYNSQNLLRNYSAVAAKSPLLGWPDLSADELLQGIEIAMHAELEEVRRWSAFEFLVNGFDPAEEDGAAPAQSSPHHEGDVFYAHMARFHRRALPLWPESELDVHEERAAWLLTAPSISNLSGTQLQNGNFSTTDEQDAFTQVMENLALESASSPADALTILCWRVVELGQENSTSGR